MSKKKVENAIAISNAHISFVSLVDKAANLRTFLITKQKDDKANFQTSGKILKVSDEDNKHYITGIVYEPMTEDYHHNYMTADEIEKACHWFAKNGNQVDIQHCFVKEEGLEVVENYIAPCDMTIGEEPIVKGTWLMKVECTNDDVWEAVQKGEITGLSMGGLGDYADVDVDISKSEGDADDKLSAIHRIAKFLGFKVKVEKGEVKDRYQKRAIYDCFWDAFYALYHTLFDWDDNIIKQPDELKECLVEFNEIAENLLLNGNIGALTPPDLSLMKSEGVTIMTDEKLKETIEKAAQKAVELSQPAPAANGDPAPAGDDNTPAPIEKTYSQEELDSIVKSAVEKTAAETAKRYSEAYGVSKQLESDNPEEPVEKSVFAGLI